jgi:Leucine-rich repeat (LRR) protein
MNNNISDVGIGRLAEHEHLEALELDGNQAVKGVGFKALKKLCRLSITKTELTEEGFSAIGDLVNLKVLYLDHSNLTDAGLSHLRGLTKLQVIWRALRSTTTGSKSSECWTHSRRLS